MWPLAPAALASSGSGRWRLVASSRDGADAMLAPDSVRTVSWGARATVASNCARDAGAPPISANRAKTPTPDARNASASTTAAP